jgi:hypothetical protein
MLPGTLPVLFTLVTATLAGADAVFPALSLHVTVNT